MTQTPALSLERSTDATRSSPAPSGDGSLRQSYKALLFGAYKHLGFMRLHEALRALVRPPHVTAFLLHRVTDQIPPDGLTVSTAWFRDFCKLMKSSYRVVSLDEIDRYLRTGEAPPRRTVSITFDDSYADNFEAARVLHEQGLKATFFLPTGYIDTNHRFPWDEHLPPMANLTWDQARQMAAWGHEIGSHSVTHPDFATLDDAAALKELVDSRATLQEKLQRPVKWFAFPFGARTSFRPEQVELVRQAGYEACFSAYGGPIEMNTYGQVLQREAVPYFRNLTQLEMHVNRCLDWMYRLKGRTV